MQLIFFCSRHAITLEVPRMVTTRRFDFPISKTKWMKNLLLAAKVVTVKQDYKTLKVLYIYLTLKTL